MPGVDLLPNHRAMLERAVEHFRDDERVGGMVLGGSLAHGVADSYSDIDLYIIASNEVFDALFDERDSAARTVGSPLLSFTVDHIPGGSRDYIVTYPGPIKLDLMYHRESEVMPATKWAGCVVLKDVSGLIADVLVRSRDLALPTPTSEELIDLDQRLWTFCWYVFGKIMRGELWEALDGIHTIRSDVLLPMLDWTAGRPHEGYRRLETKLAPGTTERLVSTLAPLEAVPLYDALQAEISFYFDLRGPLFELRDLAFDPASGNEIRDEMVRRWGARGK